MSLLVLAALVLGIGVNTAVFSVVNSVLLRPMQISDPDRVAFLYAKSPQSAVLPVSYPEYQDWKAQSHSFQDMAAYQPFLFNLKLSGQAEGVFGLRVTASAFATFGISPALGRGFLPSDERPGAQPVVVLSHGLWEDRFGSDPNILGKTINLQGQPYSVVGVFPPTDFPLISDLWVGVGPFLDSHLMNRETRYFSVVGRRAPLTDQAQAQREMDIIGARLAAQYPKSNKDLGIAVTSLTDSFTATIRKPLWLIVTASALILVLACVNVITVFIASAIERRKELSVRLALGANRSILSRQLFVQSLLFAVVGAVLGFVVAKAGIGYLIRHFPLAVVRFQQTRVDQTVFWFALGLAVSCMLLSNVLPGLYISRLNINNELKGERVWSPFSRYRVLSQGGLIIFEVALAAALSIVSGLLIKSFYQAQKIDMGFNPHHLLSFEIWLPETQYKVDAARTAFYERALENLKSVPGVNSVSAGFTLPAVTGTHTINLQVDGQSPFAAERPFVDSNSVMPGFLATMKIGILQGRDFTDEDRADTMPVAIVDEVLAARMWPGKSALGKRLRLADISDNRPPWREIVGVVRQVRYFGPESKVERLQVYEPVAQHPPPFISFVMDSSLPLAVLKSPVEKAIHNVDPDLPLQYFQPLQDFLDQRESRRKISFLLLSSFAAIGIALGLIGIYGVVSNSIVRRRREIAIRMALGSSTKKAVFLVSKLGLLASLAGIALGSIVAISLKGVLSAFLFGVKPLDPGIYLLCAIGIALLALIASLVPAATLLQLTPQDILRE